MFGFLCISILMAAAGVFIFLRPDLLWKLTERWKSYAADEPSDFYIAATKAGGVLMALAGVALCIARFVLE